MSLQLTIACGDYDRTHPLIDGSIRPEGLELEVEKLFAPNTLDL